MGYRSPLESRIAKKTTKAITDFGLIDGDGFIFIKGRADEAIIRGGLKVLPEEVAAVLRQHENVKEAAVLGVKDERLGAVPIAVVETGGAPPPADDEAVLVGVGKAMAAFQETLETEFTPFDQFRDALARGDKAAVALYPRDAKRGLQIFIGKGNCSTCHTGPMFTNGEFHDVGVSHFISNDGKRVDAGRHEGIKKLLGSKFRSEEHTSELQSH